MARNRKRKNNHHLVWPRTEQIGLRKVVRQLPCLQVTMDIEVHRVLHQMYGCPKPMTIEDAEYLLSRHKDRVCACYDPDSGEPVNILGINASKGLVEDD